MDTCDVLIVGGGPAGSSCARALRKADVDVVLLDKANFPRDKVCAGWITPAVVQELSLDLADYAGTRTLQPITGFRTSMLGGPDILTHFGETVSFGIRRCEFDAYLLDRCQARMHLGCALQTLTPHDDGWVVNNQWKTHIVIGAGGHFCPVARFASGTEMQETSCVLAQEIEFELSPAQRQQCCVAGETPELFFCPDLKGYGWCFRKGNYLNVGLGREGERNLSASVAEFCSFLKTSGKLPFDVHEKFHGHAYRLYHYTPRVSRYASILLIGDSAGLAYSESGEGIRPAIESGLMAAAAIVQARRDRRSDAARQFQVQLAQRFGRPGQWSLGSLLPTQWKRRIAGRLLTSPRFTRQVLLDRWFLHRHQPPWTRMHQYAGI